jgi:CheY-like chemotaxis protein
MRLGYNLKRKVKLLVIDHQKQHFDLLKECAEMIEHEVSFDFQLVRSSKKARELIQSWEPAVVLADLYTPGVSGFGLAEEYRGGATPVVLTSRNASNEIRETAMAKGARDFLPKSDNLEEIESLLFRIAEIADGTITRH